MEKATATTISPYIKVEGHVLQGFGGAFDSNGKRLDSPRTNKYGKTHGKALCSCGETSNYLWGNKNRKDWFRQHKEEVKEELDKLTAYKKTCSRCKKVKTANKDDKKKSDFYIFIDREQEKLKVSSHCKKCDQARTRHNDQGRKLVEKSILVSARLHAQMKSVATVKRTTLTSMTNKAIKFYLQNSCPGRYCDEVSPGGHLCRKCREKTYDTTIH